MTSSATVNDPFVDAHVHFWDHSVDGLRWPWLEPEFDHPRLKGINRLDAPRYTTDEFLVEAAGSGVAGAVHVQAASWSERPERETEWLEGLANFTGWPHAIVGNVRLAHDNALDVVEAHRCSPRFRGVRDLSVSMPELSDVALIDRAAAVAAAAGTLELMATHEHFPELAAIARRAPDGVLVLGHAGLPVERTVEYRAAWLQAMRSLAEVPNVVCKVSALASSSDPVWTVESLRPWVLGCIEVFGPERCMLATNWPIDRLFGSYDRLVGAYRQILESLTAVERADVFHGTAGRVYRITPSP